MTSSKSQKPRWHPAIAPAIEAFSNYWPAMLLIQLVALAVVLSYYLIEGTAELFLMVADLKAKGGIFFSGAATVVSGGIIPECIKRFFRPKGSHSPSFGELLHQFSMWGLVGILVDLFYRLQSILFGEGNDALTLITKVCADQLVFTPLLCLPFICLWFILREVHYNPRRFIAHARPKIIWQRVLPLWTTCLCFWPVMLCIVYSLPALLQFPLFLLGNAAWSILMIFIVRRQGDNEDAYST